MALLVPALHFALPRKPRTEGWSPPTTCGFRTGGFDNASRVRRASQSLALALLALSCTTGLATAAPAAPADRVLPIDQYQSEKARRLATTHAGALRDLAAGVYHCMPWVDVQKHSIGFFKPKHVEKDDRYLSIRMYIEQDPSAEFAALSMEQRATSMFSVTWAPCCGV